MRRRDFLKGMGALVALPPAADAQQAGKVHRIAVVFAESSVSVGSKNPHLEAFIQRLRELGYVEGRNIIIERRSAEGDSERYGDLMAEAVRLNPEVLVTVGNRMTHAAKRATPTIPIVMVTSSQPVETGLVSSLSRPGGNVSGQTTETGPELEEKRLELFKETVPRISRVAYIHSKTVWERWGASARRAARALGVELVFVEMSTPAHLRTALVAAVRNRLDGLVSGNSLKLSLRGK